MLKAALLRVKEAGLRALISPYWAIGSMRVKSTHFVEMASSMVMSSALLRLTDFKRTNNYMYIHEQGADVMKAIVFLS